MSESGYPGLKDVQDEEGDFLMMSMILNGALLYYIAIAMIKILWCGHLAR